ncbi:NOP protein chaperone 1 [Patagioenas fasciata]|uniref:NOP protein chaperone 1 n=1 Tax=Patagioenas fasciata TaxID=372321 RepID=UPI003A98D1E3
MGGAAVEPPGKLLPPSRGRCAAPRRDERPARRHFRLGRHMAGDGGAAGPGASRELLTVGRRGGLEETLLISSKCSSKKATTLQTVRMPRSNVLDRVQSFLPQMAHANDELRRKMVAAPAHQFDIENLDSATDKVIEMNVAVVELSDSDTDEEILTSEDDSESEDGSVTEEVTIDNIKFPKQKGEKGKIEILDSKVNE